MRGLSTVIAGLQVTAVLHTPPSDEGPGVGITITGDVDGTPVSGSLHDLFTRGALPAADSEQPVRVPEPVIDQIDEWCLQYLI